MSILIDKLKRLEAEHGKPRFRAKSWMSMKSSRCGIAMHMAGRMP